MGKFLLFAVVAALLSLPAAAGAASPQQLENGKEGRALSTSQEISELEKLAKAGNADAQFRLGEALLLNFHVNAAQKWLEKSAANGNLLAEARLFFVRFCYRWKSNPSEPFAKFDQLAALDSDEAHILLGDFYQAGCGVDKDWLRGRSYLTHAAQNGYRRAELSLAFDDVYDVLMPENQAKSLTAMKKMAEQGYAPALALLGYFYEEGQVVPGDLQKAFAWYQKAAEQGHGLARSELATCYEEGKGTATDTQKAFACYLEAAEQGYEIAQFRLGNCYMAGIGTPKDTQKAVFWYQKAAEQGHKDAIKALQELKGCPRQPRRSRWGCRRFCRWETR